MINKYQKRILKLIDKMWVNYKLVTYPERYKFFDRYIIKLMIFEDTEDSDTRYDYMMFENSFPLNINKFAKQLYQSYIKAKENNK